MAIDYYVIIIILTHLSCFCVYAEMTSTKNAQNRNGPTKIAILKHIMVPIHML